MIVILNRDVKGSGKAGDVVKVSDGYARNMLIPKGWAVEATKGNINTLEKVKAKKAEEEAAAKAAAQETASKIEDLTVTIKTKAGDGGRLFGSITTKDVSKALEEQHGIKVDKKKMNLNQPIKALGTFTVPMKLYSGVSAELTVKVEE